MSTTSTAQTSNNQKLLSLPPTVSTVSLSKDEKFSLFPLQSKHKQTWKWTSKNSLAVGPVIKTPIFTLFNINWYVLLTPPFIGPINKSTINEPNKYLSAFLVMQDNRSKIPQVKVDFSIELLKFEKNSKHSKSASYQFSLDRQYSGFSEYLEFNKIEKSLYNKDDEFKLMVSISIVEEDDNKQLFSPINDVSKLILSQNPQYQSIYYLLFFIPKIRSLLLKLPIDDSTKRNHSISYQLQKFFFYLGQREKISDDKYVSALNFFATFHHCLPIDFRRFYIETILQIFESVRSNDSKDFSKIFSLLNSNQDGKGEVKGAPQLQSYGASSSFLQMLKNETSLDTNSPSILSVFLPYASYLNQENKTGTPPKDSDNLLCRFKYPEIFSTSEIYQKRSNSDENCYVLYGVVVHERKSLISPPLDGEFYTFLKSGDQWFKISSSNDFPPEIVSFSYILAASSDMVAPSLPPQQKDLKRSISSAYMLVYLLKSELPNLYSQSLDFTASSQDILRKVEETDVLEDLIPPLVPIDEDSSDSDSSSDDDDDKKNKIKNFSSNGTPVITSTPTTTTTTTTKHTIDNSNQTVSNDRTESLMNRIKELESTVSKITSILDDNQKRVESFEQLIKQTKLTADKYMKQNKETQDQLNQEKNTSNNLRTENNNLRNELQKANKAATQAKTDLEKNQTIFDIIKREKDLYQSEKAKTENKLKTLEKRLANWEGGVDKIESMDPMELYETQSKLTHSLSIVSKALENRNLCVVCYETPRNITLIPCGHNVTCEKCTASLKTCPICRKNIHSKVKTYYI